MHTCYRYICNDDHLFFYLLDIPRVLSSAPHQCVRGVYVCVCIRKMLKEECKFRCSFSHRHCFQRTSNAVPRMGWLFCIISILQNASATDIPPNHPHTHLPIQLTSNDLKPTCMFLKAMQFI